MTNVSMKRWHTERDRVAAQGCRSDDSRCTLLVIHKTAGFMVDHRYLEPGTGLLPATALGQEDDLNMRASVRNSGIDPTMGIVIPAKERPTT